MSEEALRKAVRKSLDESWRNEMDSDAPDESAAVVRAICEHIGLTQNDVEDLALRWTFIIDNDHAEACALANKLQALLEAAELWDIDDDNW